MAKIDALFTKSLTFLRFILNLPPPPGSRIFKNIHPCFSKKIIVRYKEIEKGTKGRRRKTSKPGERSTDLLNSGKDRDDDKKVLCKMIKSKMMMKIICRMIQDL